MLTPVGGKWQKAELSGGFVVEGTAVTTPVEQEAIYLRPAQVYAASPGEEDANPSLGPVVRSAADPYARSSHVRVASKSFAPS